MFRILLFIVGVVVIIVTVTVTQEPLHDEWAFISSLSLSLSLSLFVSFFLSSFLSFFLSFLFFSLSFSGLRRPDFCIENFREKFSMQKFSRKKFRGQYGIE